MNENISTTIKGLGEVNFIYKRPTIVCLCGSSRFYKEFIEANFKETMADKIVLSIGFYYHVAEIVHGKHIEISEFDKIKQVELHKRKIELADEILVINVGGYIGESTRNEINYAIKHEKKVRYLESIYDKKL